MPNFFVGFPGGMDSSSPTKFLDVDLKLTEIHYHPKEVLVKFQGQYSTEYEFDYHILQNEIQQVPKVKDSVGIGDFCLVEESDCGEWYRGRVVRMENHIYDVFLIDRGKILSVYEAHIACATEELFQLPPKIVSGIFANILPIDEKWSPKALNYFSALKDLKIKGYIEAILQHQTLLLDVPKITSDIVELNLGKLVDGDTFRLIVEILTECPQEPLGMQMPDLLQQKYTSSTLFNTGSEPEQPILHSLQPRLSVGGVEKVRISMAVSPSKFHCQLLRQQMELDKLTAHMSSYYETLSRENVSLCDNLGVLCAARQRNGQWHRGVIQQLLSDSRVKVWFMDFGCCQAVPSWGVLKLHPEFISVPRFAFPCALSCLSDEDENVRRSQLEEFKETLLRQNAVYVHVDLFSVDEHLYYVTLQKHGTVVNPACPSQENDVIPKCQTSFSTTVSCTGGDTEIPDTNHVFSHCVDRNTLQSEYSFYQKLSDFMCDPLTIPCRRSEMKIDLVCVAFLVYVLNPSTFWVQINDRLDDFEHLMKQISAMYDTSETDDKILENPQPGQICCARYHEDMHFYRAVIIEVEDNSINVYFLDFGNTETVPLSDVRILLPEFQELPALAICCSLANAFPVDDVWTKRETDFFKTIVLGKLLMLHPIAKEENKYIVNVQCMNGTKKDDVLMLMVQVGYAECWEIKQDPFLKTVRGSQGQRSHPQCKKTRVKPVTQKNKVVTYDNAGQNRKSQNTFLMTKEPTISSLQGKSVLSSKCGKAFGKFDKEKHYRYCQFEPGTVFDVVCCHSSSPGDFSCQIRSQLPELNSLMEQIQSHYNTNKIPYENGQVACVVKHAKDGKWYRGVVLKHLSQMEVDVLFVDYGNKETVFLRDVQAIFPDFLILESQAFRCCASNVTESLTFDPHNWSMEACRDFQHFVESANVLLTCTISALVVRHPNHLYHVVDLQTPFTNLQQFLLERGHIQTCSFELTKSLAPSFSLHSFCYSSFNIQIGCEEEMCITHIGGHTKIFCQLSRNASVLDKLGKKIAEISRIPKQTSQTNTLCLAKYVEDGLFYRALVSSAGSLEYWLVYFVDFGNKELVTKNELLPIPGHASELLFTPMQAVKCYLAHLEGIEIPLEVDTWFENNYLGKQLRVVIVAKESDGWLGVELYDGDLLINRKIKELIKSRKCDKKPKVTQKCAEKLTGDKNMVLKQKNADKTNVKAQVIEQKRERKTVKSSNQSDDKLYAKYSKENVDLEKQCSRPAKFPTGTENRDKCLQNILGQRYKNANGEFSKESVDCPSVQSEELLKNSATESHALKLNSSKQERNSIKPKYTCLQLPNVKPHSKALGYISCISSLSNFYIHCAENENKIVELAETLNGGTLVLEPKTDGEIDEGDIVLAEYEVDCCIYRAVVREVKSEKSFEVEFIDYGNRSTVDASKIYKMGKIFLNIPRLSIHCFLSRAKCGFPEKNWSSDATADFVSKVNNQPVNFEFLQQHGQQWEVDIFCQGISVINELMQTEVSLGLQGMLALNLDQIRKSLPITDADFDSNFQNQRSKNQNASESHPKVAFQKLQPGQLEPAEIGHVSREGNFYVRLSKNVQILSDLNMIVAQEAEKSSFLAVENIEEGLEYLAKSKSTMKWYRSEIIKKYVNEEHMLVFFMDLGKFEMVSLYDTQLMSDKIRSIPRNAVLCKWVWIKNLSSLSFKKMAKIIKCHKIKILFLRYLESAFVWEVDILIDGILLFEYWNRSPLIKSLESFSLSENLQVDKKVQFKQTSVSWASFHINEEYPGFVTSVTDPSDFFVQLDDSFEALKTLFKLLSDLPENLPSVPHELIVPGACCLIKAGANAKWTRVEVSEVSRISGQITLTLIDDGLSIAIPISNSHKLKVIPEKYITLPRLTYPCSLARVLPAGGVFWSDEAKLQVQEFLGRQGLTFQFRRYSHGLKLEVDVFCGQSNVAEALVASGCAVYSENASSLGSISSAEPGLPNSQNHYDPPKICHQKKSVARLSEEEEQPQKPDLPLKCICSPVPRQNSKRLIPRKKGWQKTVLDSNRRNSESQLKSDNSLFDRFNARGTFGKACPTNVQLETLCEMEDVSEQTTEIDTVSELTTKVDGMQIYEESLIREHVMRKVSIMCLLK